MKVRELWAARSRLDTRGRGRMIVAGNEQQSNL